LPVAICCSQRTHMRRQPRATRRWQPAAERDVRVEVAAAAGEQLGELVDDADRLGHDDPLEPRAGAVGVPQA